MSAALVTHAVLRWARERARLEPDQLAEKTHVGVDKILLWEQGQAKPTFKQAQNLANVLHVPFGYLFLPQPPVETLPIPDLRTVGNQAGGQLSLDTRDLITDVLRKQDWYRDYLLDLGADPLPFIGRFDLDAGVADIAADLTETLRLTLSDRVEAPNWESFLTRLSQKAEDAGILTMRSGIVGGNTRRGLSVQEFRGFAICDNMAPLVFINGQDARAAQIFTLVHEISHLWVGQSGISATFLEQPPNALHHRVEKLCNAVAAEVLVPAQSLHGQWISREAIGDNADRLSKYFRVSSVVVARRAADLALIEWDDYAAYYRQQTALWQQKKDRQGGGGNYYRTLLVRNGHLFTAAVIRSAYGQNLLFRDAGSLLGVNPAKLAEVAREMGIR